MQQSRSEDRSTPGTPKGTVRVEYRTIPKESEQPSAFQSDATGANIVLIVDGFDVVFKVNKTHNVLLRRWLTQLKNSEVPYRLRPTHVVTKNGRTYEYPGTYWYKYDPPTRRWTYVGRELPKDVDASKIPPTPLNPLDGFEYERVGRGRTIIAVAALVRKFRPFFKNCPVYTVMRSGL